MNMKKELQTIIEKAQGGKEGSEKDTLQSLLSDLQGLVEKVNKEEKIAKLKAKISQLQKE